MDFSDEPSVKIYTTETLTVRSWGFWGTVLMEQLVKKANRAGVIELDGDMLKSMGLPSVVAAVIGCGQNEVAWVEEYLPCVLEHGSVQQIEGKSGKPYLVVTRYHEAQYGKVGNKLSKRLSAQKLRDTEAAGREGLIDKPRWWPKKVHWVGDEVVLDEAG